MGGARRAFRRRVRLVSAGRPESRSAATNRSAESVLSSSSMYGLRHRIPHSGETGMSTRLGLKFSHRPAISCARAKKGAPIMAEIVALAATPAAEVAKKIVRHSDEKWGAKVMGHGYSIVPSIFIR